MVFVLHVNPLSQLGTAILLRHLHQNCMCFLILYFLLSLLRYYQTLELTFGAGMLQKCYHSRNCDNLIAVTYNPAYLLLFRRTFVTAINVCIIMPIVFFSTSGVLTLRQKTQCYLDLWLSKAQQHNLLNLKKKRKSKKISVHVYVL